MQIFWKNCCCVHREITVVENMDILNDKWISLIDGEIVADSFFLSFYSQQVVIASYETPLKFYFLQIHHHHHFVREKWGRIRGHVRCQHTYD